MCAVSLITWAQALLGSIAVCLSGIFPALFIKLYTGSDKAGSYLKLLLGIAIGSLLGDAYLHLLPESWIRLRMKTGLSRSAGIWTISAVVLFASLESLVISNLKDPKHAAGYMNLFANSLDNFVHGLAVGEGCLVNFKVGMLTIAAILFHEIPHELSDFALLLRSGYSCNRAVKAQFLTSTSGIFGSILALLINNSDSTGVLTSVLLAFVSGGFMYVSLTSVLPDLLEEKNPRESIGQVAAVLIGIGLIHKTMKQF